MNKKRFISFLLAFLLACTLLKNNSANAAVQPKFVDFTLHTYFYWDAEYEFKGIDTEGNVWKGSNQEHVVQVSGMQNVAKIKGDYYLTKDNEVLNEKNIKLPINNIQDIKNTNFEAIYLKDGKVYEFERNENSDESKITPTMVSELSNIKSIEMASEYFSSGEIGDDGRYYVIKVAIDTNNTVYVWGNSYINNFENGVEVKKDLVKYNVKKIDAIYGEKVFVSKDMPYGEQGVVLVDTNDIAWNIPFKIIEKNLELSKDKHLENIKVKSINGNIVEDVDGRFYGKGEANFGELLNESAGNYENYIEIPSVRGFKKVSNCMGLGRDGKIYSWGVGGLTANVSDKVSYDMFRLDRINGLKEYYDMTLNRPTGGGSGYAIPGGMVVTDDNDVVLYGGKFSKFSNGKFISLKKDYGFNNYNRSYDDGRFLVDNNGNLFNLDNAIGENKIDLKSYTDIKNPKVIKSSMTFSVAIDEKGDLYMTDDWKAESDEGPSSIYAVKYKSKKLMSKVKDVYFEDIGRVVFLLEDGRMGALQSDITTTGTNFKTEYYEDGVNIEKILYEPEFKDYSQMTPMYVFLQKRDGTVWGAGDNSNGQLGNGTTSNSKILTQVKNIKLVKQMNVNYDYVEAVLENGEVYAWGRGITTPIKADFKVPIEKLRDRNDNLALDKNGGIWSYDNISKKGIVNINKVVVPEKVVKMDGAFLTEQGNIYNYYCNDYSIYEVKKSNIEKVKHLVKSNVTTTNGEVYGNIYSLSRAFGSTSLNTFGINGPTENIKSEDVNKDGKVDIEDLALVSSLYNSRSYERVYSEECDIQLDYIIDIYDLVKVSKKM